MTTLKNTQSFTTQETIDCIGIKKEIDELSRKVSESEDSQEGSEKKRQIKKMTKVMETFTERMD